MRSWELSPPHPFEELWEGWARTMRVRKLAEGTIDSRRTNWRKWFDHIGGRWTEATDVDVEEWLDGRPLAETATCRAISDLAEFYRWARRRGLTSANPTDLIERPRIPRRLPRPADEPGIARALALGRVEDRRAVALMFYAGLRCCEVSRLDWGEVELAEGWLRLAGKGGVPRQVPIFPPLEPFLAPGAGERGHVYTTTTGKPANPARVSALVNTHLRDVAGCSFTAHQVRHRFGTHMLAQTKNLRLVQVLMGHANVSTTEIYTLVELNGFSGLHDLW